MSNSLIDSVRIFDSDFIAIFEQNYTGEYEPLNHIYESFIPFIPKDYKDSVFRIEILFKTNKNKLPLPSVIKNRYCELGTFTLAYIGSGPVKIDFLRYKLAINLSKFKNDLKLLLEVFRSLSDWELVKLIRAPANLLIETYEGKLIPLVHFKRPLPAKDVKSLHTMKNICFRAESID